MSQVYSGFMVKILSTIKGVKYSFFFYMKSAMALWETLSKGRTIVHAKFRASSFYA